MEKEFYDKLVKEVFTEQNEKELTDVINLVEGISPKVIVEIGMKSGGTLNFWRHLVSSDGLVVGIDSQNDIKWDVSTDSRVKIIIGNSLDYRTYQNFLAALGGKEIDFLFIDGGHMYHEAKSDFYTYGWYVKKGGLIAIHDTHLDSVGEPRGAVKQFWQEVKDRSGRKWEVVYDEKVNTGMGVVRLG